MAVKDQVFTDLGVEWSGDRELGSGTYSAKTVSHGQMGTSSVASDKTQTALVASHEGRDAVTTTRSAFDTVKYEYTHTFTTGANILEFGLFLHVSNAEMVARATLDAAIPTVDDSSLKVAFNIRQT